MLLNFLFGREKQKYNFVVSRKTHFFLTSGEIKLLMLEYTFTYNEGIFLSTDINAMKHRITMH